MGLAVSPPCMHVIAPLCVARSLGARLPRCCMSIEARKGARVRCAQLVQMTHMRMQQSALATHSDGAARGSSLLL